MAEFVNVSGRPMLTFTTIVLLSGFAIGLAFGAVGLLSGFCLTSGLRNWTTEGTACWSALSRSPPAQP